MNKHHHRIVFNKVRGILMAVAETAASHSGGHGQSRGMSAREVSPGASHLRPLITRLQAHLMLAWGAVIMLLSVAVNAQIVADPRAPGNQQPTITSTGSNNVPLVNIQTPSAAGVSRNTYSQFDVQRNGVILNNARTNVQTQMGGWVQGNPWLAAGSARVILNEVTSGNPSQLAGFMEVAGQRAQVIVANPAGISCVGCGFINANRGTLTTGMPLITNGNLDGYRVTGGLIEITGAGLQGQSTDYTDLISRAVKVNAGIWAQQLQVTTGVNQVSSDQTTVTPLATGQATDSAPAFALDTSQLGGMYAGKIVLVGTEAGLGMRNAGQISGTSGSLTLTHEGQLINTGLIDGQDTLITAAALNNLGSGRIYGDNLAISAATLTQTAQTSGNQLRSPVIAARQRLDIGASNLQNNEQALIFSAGDLFVGGALGGNRHATLDAPGRAATLNNVGGRIEALGALTLNASTVNNSNAGFTTQVVETSRSTQQEYQLSGSPNRWQPAQITYIDGRNNDREVDSINTPEGGAEDFNRYDYTRVIKQTQVTSSKPGNIVSGGNMVLTGGTLNNTDSRILAGGTLTATVAQVNNVATPGTSTTTDSGSVTHLYRIQHKGRDEQGEDSAVYTPPAVIQNITVSPQVMQAHTAPSSVSGASSQTSVPGNGLLITTPLSSAAPLIEVDPRFANQRQWLSSDYMMSQLSIDPATVQKRLGDGFYEQSLVRDQVAQLTGRRFLDGYSGDEAQYRVLIDNGVTVARALNLRPGVALSAAQAAQLTSDIVVLETTTVTLANGQTAQVLKPQVYLKPRAGDLQANGNLMAAQNLNLQVSGDVVTSGGMGARQVLSVSANNIRNAGSSLNAQSANLQATQDIALEGGQISATDQLSLQAGRDISLSTTTASNSNAQGGRTYTDRIASLYVSGAAGQLLVNAARDASLQGAQVANQGAGGQTTLSAGRNLALGTVQTSERNDIVWNSQNQRHDATSQEVGSLVQTQGNIVLQAGQDLSVRAASVQSQSGALTATAAGQVRIEAGQTQQTVNEAHQSRSKGLLSSKTTTKRDTADNTLSQGSTLSATSVGVNAGQNIAVKGSSVVSDNGTTLNAQGNVSIEATHGRLSSTHSVDTKQSGLLGGGGGIGITVGTRQQSNAQADSSTTSLASTVGSTAGSVHVNAGQQYSQVGSDVLTPVGNVNITAKKVDIVAAQNTSSDTTQTRYKQTGVTVALTNPIISAVQTARQMKKAGSQTQDSRMKALSKLTTVLAANNAAGDVAKDPNNAGGVNLSLSLGHSQSASQRVQSSTTSSGSRIQAGGEIDIKATGAVSASDLTVKGSDLKAGNNVNLQADNAVNLLAEQNTAQQHSTNHNTSASVGVSIGTDGLLLNVGASGGRGKANGSDSTWANTHVEAGQNLNLTSGGDTTLKGAVAKGQQVTARVGGKLNVQSLQDTSTFDSKQQSLGGSVSVGYGKTGGGISASQTTVNSDYASVTEQTGIQAGDRGFTITVNGATVLTGAVIASSDKAVQEGKNSLVTASLSTTDIQNKADYEAKAISVSAGSKAGQSSAGFGSDSGHASSTTTAGVSGIAGNKAVRTGDKQQGIAKIFDQEQVTQEVGAQVAITSAFGQQAAKAVGDFGQSKTKPVDDAHTRQQLDALAAQGQLTPDGQKMLDALTKQGMTSAQAQANLSNPALLADYDNWKEGGAYRVAAHTAVGALAGGAGGALGSGTTAATMPTVADAINDLKLPEPVRQAVIAATGTVIGATVGGTAGAVSGFNQTTNNYLTHDEASRRAKLMAQRLQCKDQSCATSTQAEIDKLNKLDVWRDQQIASACQTPSSAMCSAWAGDIKAAAASYKGKFDSDPLINNERSSVLNDAFKYSQANNNPTLYGVGKGLLKLSPPGAVAGLAVGGYALVSAIVENGAVDTAIKLAQGIKDLPSDIKARLNSDDPSVRGEALVDAIGLGAGAAALTTKLATTGYGVVVARAEANVVRQAETTAVANQLREVAIHKDDSRFSQVAETIVEAKQAGWKTPDGRTWWPPENGKVPGTERTAELTVGQRLDRYGGTTDKSSFLAPSSTPIEQRALSPATDLSVHDQYVVVKPFAVEESRAMPWFDKPGMGIQYETTQGIGLTISKLLEKGYIKKVGP
jgi:filamentous hemagglutinin